MKLNRRVLTGIAATGVAAGVLTAGGVALASTGSSGSPTAAVAAAVATPTGTPTPAPGWCANGAGAMGSGYGMWAGAPVMQAAASYLGVSQDTLLSQLQSGKSLADIATAQGKSVSGLKSAILAAGTKQINASTTLSAAQKADLISGLKSHLDAIVNGTYPAGMGMHRMGQPGRGPGWMPGGMPGI
jgi:hypothetical protein